MIREELRPLIYRERKDIREFKKECHSWEVLHTFYKDHVSYYEVINPLELLNDVRYFCVEATSAAKGDTLLNIVEVSDFKSEKYSWPSGAEYGGLVCAMVYTVLKHLENPPRTIVQLLEKTSEYDAVLKAMDEISRDNFYLDELPKYIGERKFDIDLSPEPELPERLPEDSAWWGMVTDNFQLARFIEILEYWQTPEEQLQVLKRFTKILKRDFPYGLLPEYQFLAECLRARVQLKKLQKQMEKEDAKRLPVTAFLDYVEQYFTPDENAQARVVGRMLLALYPEVTKEERERVNRLGTKMPPSPSLTINGPMYDVHHNNNVNAG